MAGFSVPLLKAFEIRDVDWARLVMAIFSIVGLSLALLEVCAPLHAIIVCLGGEYQKSFLEHTLDMSRLFSKPAISKTIF